MKKTTNDLPVYAPMQSDETMDPIGHRIQAYAQTQGDKVALIDERGSVTWRELLQQVNRIANRLRDAGLETGDCVAGLSENTREYLSLYLGTLVAGGCMVPLSGMASAEALTLMIRDCGARFLFVSRKNLDLWREFRDSLDLPAQQMIGLDTMETELSLPEWLGTVSDDANPAAVSLDDAFNIIYSSGTTGTPKGILHDYRFRQRQMVRMARFGLDDHAINLVSTPLYSNTTLVSVLPTLFNGGTLVMMARFDAHRFLELAEQHRVTHAMLVPVQYQRILAVPDFDRFDLSSFELKLCTSAPLRADVIAEAMRRWPGNIREVYGLTEGGISTSLDCAAHPDKWDSVGVPTEGAEVRVIDEDGRELPRGEIGEIVGRAISMMRGYVNRPEQTAEMLWTSPEGEVFYRSGDMGRIDEDGFIYILDRRKDMIISGGFNIYAVDLENVLLGHPAVADVAVIGIPSDRWGETPLALVVRKAGSGETEADLLDWANQRLGKTQRLAAVEFRDELPRSTIGKVLKRELRAPYWETPNS
ncbi:class I adenylate-forming enzyme family protein [uncultured Marinobacter sp.]|uniref:class I adenylate-forming enzyme family protein n=1 Tax=uncultured Marinobacter sp. TaxID=187379 RepID=UPI000C35EACC|nr:4-coumarate--CoA ligase [Oceanospirillales bacterium]|tara:strand:- start:8258 stop:9850 length:1593 start_codon:yes stop_codon:yes gene_type:complete